MDSQNPALSRGDAREALMEREAKPCGNRFLAAHGENSLQQLGLLAPEHDAEDVIIHDLPDAVGDALEELLAIENGGQLPAHLIQQGKGLGLFRKTDVKTLRNGIRITQEGESSEF